MKAYIIITNTIYGYGGGQLLTLRKAKFLESIGYKVIIIYKSNKGDFKLEKEFENFKTLYISEFGKPYNFVKSDKRDTIISHLVSVIGYVDKANSIIESHDTATAVWAEFLSGKIQIKHILYLILETNMNRLHYYPYKQFYIDKLKRNEFWGCNSRGLDLSFSEELIDYKDNFVDVAFDEYEVPEKSYPEFHVSEWHKETKLVIATVTRLEKAYLNKLIEKIERYSLNHLSLYIEFIIVGGSTDKYVIDSVHERISKINDRVPNLNIIMTGYMVPGVDFYNEIDIFIGTGTAVINAISKKCITIPYNTYTDKTPGIFGIESSNFAYPEAGKEEYSIESTIDRILGLTKCVRYEYHSRCYEFYKENYSMVGTWNKTLFLLQKVEKDSNPFDFKYARFWLLSDCIFYILTVIRDTIRSFKHAK